MKPTEGAVYCWVVRVGPRQWKAFHERKEARAYRREHGGRLLKLVEAH